MLHKYLFKTQKAELLVNKCLLDEPKDDFLYIFHPQLLLLVPCVAEYNRDSTSLLQVSPRASWLLSINCN